MTGHPRKRGSSWEVVLELGRQPAQRCPACMATRGRAGGRLLWSDKGRHEECPACGGPLEDVTARRQIVLPDRYRTKREAQGRLTRELQAGADGEFVEPSTLTVGEFLTKEWLPSLAAEELAANTVLVYTVHVEQRIKPTLGSVLIQKLTTRDITAFATHMATHNGARGKILAPGTRRQCLVVLKKALRAAVVAGYISHNPAHGVKLPKVRRREMRFWTAGELHTFLETTRSDRLYPLWRYLSQTGLRRGEALGLRLEALDLESGKVIIDRQRSKVGYEVHEGPMKTDSCRRISLDRGTVAALREQLQRQLDDAQEWGEAWQATGHVFTREDGSPWHPDRITKLFDQAVKAAPVPRIRLHDLRHTWATIALLSGEHLKVVSERVGHKSVKTTLDVYSHVLPDMQEHAAERVAALVDGAGEAT